MRGNAKCRNPVLDMSIRTILPEDGKSNSFVLMREVGWSFYYRVGFDWYRTLRESGGVAFATLGVGGTLCVRGQSAALRGG